MIVSTSRRTDIPALFSEWFYNRIRSGFVLLRNPYNFHQVGRVTLTPDKVEGNPFQRRSLFGIRCAHRGWSHWPMLYLLIGGVSLRGEEYLGLSLGTLEEIIFFMAVGALLHIAEDAICGKVPFITPTQKIGVKLFKVGSIREYIVALVLILGAYGIKIVLG